MSEEERAPRRNRRKGREVAEGSDGASPRPATGGTEGETFTLDDDDGGRLGWVLLVGGCLLAALTGLSLLVDTTPFGLMLCGFGLALSGGGYAVAFARHGMRELAVGRGGVVLSSADGSRATIPCPVLSEARVHQVTQTSSSGSGSSRTTTRHYYVHLAKRDGGVIDLGRQRGEAEAQRLAEDVTAAIRSHQATGGTTADALAELRGSPHLSVRCRDDDAAADYRRATKRGDLVMEWSLRPKHFEIVPALLLPFGAAVTAYGAHVREGGSLLLAISGLLAGLTLFLVARFLTRLGAAQVIRVTDEELIVEERRGGRATERRAFPLGAVTAVDYSRLSTTLGAALQLRLDGAELPSVAPGREPSSLGALARVVRQTIHLHQNSVNVPLGRLPFGDRVRVDLAVSAEVARRTAREEAAL